MNRPPPIFLRWLAILTTIAAWYVPWFLAMRWAVQDDHARRTFMLITLIAGVVPPVLLLFGGVVYTFRVDHQHRKIPPGAKPPHGP